VDGVPGNGFVRGVMRGMARDRRAHGVGMEPPFALTLWRNGTLSLTDKSTGRAIELGSFGPDNRAAFAALLPGAPA
jgi:putative photosynthetic complex assembly protein